MPNKSRMDPSCVALLADATESEFDKSKTKIGSPNCAHEEAGSVKSTLPKLWANRMKPHSVRSEINTKNSILENASTGSINSSCAGLLSNRKEPRVILSKIGRLNSELPTPTNGTKNSEQEIA